MNGAWLRSFSAKIDAPLYDQLGPLGKKHQWHYLTQNPFLDNYSYHRMHSRLVPIAIARNGTCKSRTAFQTQLNAIKARPREGNVLAPPVGAGLVTREDAGSRFAAHIDRQLVRVLAAVPERHRDDVYVLSLVLAPGEEDWRYTTVTISWNTRTHLAEKARAARDSTVRSILEWSYAGFIEPEAFVVGGDHDESGRSLRRAWLEQQDLWYEDEYIDAAAGELDLDILDAWVELLISVSRRVHESPRARELLGRSIPIFIDGVLLDERLTEINLAANPAQHHASLQRWTTRG